MEMGTPLTRTNAQRRRDQRIEDEKQKKREKKTKVTSKLDSSVVDETPQEKDKYMM